MNHLKNKKIKITILLLFCLFNVLIPKQSQAGFLNEEITHTKDKYRSLIIFSGYNETAKTPESIIASLIQYALSFLGIIFIVLTIYAGFLWMTAAGDSDKIKTAKDIFISSLMGLVIVLSAYVVTTYIIESLGSAIGV